MDTSLATRMFHALVVMGASLGGACGPTAPAASTGGSGGSGDSGSSGDPAPPLTTGPGPEPTTTSTTTTTTTTGEPMTSVSTLPTSDFTTADASTTVGTTTTGAPPDEATDCAHPQQFKCEDYFSERLDCVCDLDAPLTPEDCRAPHQFDCAIPWQDPPWGCFCDPDAPAVPEDCPFPTNFNCWQYDPVAIGCSCECEFGGVANPQTQEDCAQVGWFGCKSDFEPIGCCCHIQLG